MYDKKSSDLLVKRTDLMLSDDVFSLKKQLETGDFDYVDIASVQAWKRSLAEWPLLNEWNEWSKS